MFFVRTTPTLVILNAVKDHCIGSCFAVVFAVAFDGG